MPAPGAGAGRVTVPVNGLPPDRSIGVNETEAIPVGGGGATVSVAVFVTKRPHVALT
jgi:hypothetical protein